MSGKHQHCKILVRFFFTHHWLHLFPSLDLDYVTVKKSERQGNMLKHRDTQKMLLCHIHLQKKKKKILNGAKLLAENVPQLLL